MMNLDEWDADLLLQVIQFLNGRDAGRLALQSRRCCYLVHHYRTVRGPQLVTTSRRKPPQQQQGGRIGGGGRRRRPSAAALRTLNEVVTDAREECQSPPQLALAFGQNNHHASHFRQHLGAGLPKDTVVLGSTSQDIQVTLGPEHCHSSDSAALMLLAGLSETDTKVKPFHWNFDGDNEILFDDDDDRNDWKMFIIYVCGSGANEAEERVKALQARFPQAAIVGGICWDAYVSTPIDRSLTEDDYYANYTSHALLEFIDDVGGPAPPAAISKRELARHAFAVAQERKYKMSVVQDGICGVALAGNVPVRSVVSRGVKSMLDVKFGLDGTPRPQTSLYVHESSRVQPGDRAYMFQGERDDLPTYHLIRRLQDMDTGKMYTMQELLMHLGRFPDFVGLRAPAEDGFTLESPHPISQNLNSWLIMDEDAESFEGHNVDLYNLSGEASRKDMDICMSKLAEQTEDETILGALMFSCNGRGPEASRMMGESMADAKRFARVFPNVPCLGFYAGGEIGPAALAGRQSIFQQGKACLQGFTAVFALFIVPKVDLTSMHLDDGEENINAFIRRRLSGETESDMNNSE